MQEGGRGVGEDDGNIRVQKLQCPIHNDTLKNVEDTSIKKKCESHFRRESANEDKQLKLMDN